MLPLLEIHIQEGKRKYAGIHSCNAVNRLLLFVQNRSNLKQREEIMRCFRRKQLNIRWTRLGRMCRMFPKVRIPAN